MNEESSEVEGASDDVKRSTIYVAAADIQHRAEDAAILFNQYEHLAKQVNEMNKDLERKDRKVVSELNQFKGYTRLTRCLWEASVVKICTCWTKTKRFRTIVDTENPALVIDDVQSMDIRAALDRLRRIRNGQIAHPISNQQALTGPVQIRRSDDSEIVMDISHAIGAVYIPKVVTIEQCKDLVDVIDYTMREAKRLQDLNTDISMVGIK